MGCCASADPVLVEGYQEKVPQCWYLRHPFLLCSIQPESADRAGLAAVQIGIFLVVASMEAEHPQQGYKQEADLALKRASCGSGAVCGQ